MDQLTVSRFSIAGVKYSIVSSVRIVRVTCSVLSSKKNKKNPALKKKKMSMDQGRVEVHKIAKKRTRPISHLDQTSLFIIKAFSI